jgi:hypothetical protein
LPVKARKRSIPLTPYEGQARLICAAVCVGLEGSFPFLRPPQVDNVVGG